MIVPRQRIKLYPLGYSSDIDIRRGHAAPEEIARLRGEGYEPTIAADEGRIACGITGHRDHAVIFRDMTRYRSIAVMQVNLLPAHTRRQVGRERRKGHEPPVAADGR